MTIPAPLCVWLPVDPRSPGRARRVLTQWLPPECCGRHMVEDLALALSEAVSNCVEHAFTSTDPPEPGFDESAAICVDAVTVTSEDTRAVRVVITVTDSGRWRAPPLDTGYRGRGLPLIAALVENLHIDHTDIGTRVCMTSHLCPHN